MNKFDVKVLLEETKKQTARDIIKELNKNLAECMKMKEEALKNICEYKSRYYHLDGYEGALCDAIKCIEDDYKVGPRYILEESKHG